MPVTIPVTVYVPDVIVRRLSTEGDMVVAEYDMGPTPEQWRRPDLWKQSKAVLDGFQDPKSQDARQMVNTLMLVMRQEKRVLAREALREFLELPSARPDSISAFVQKYGLFKMPEHDRGKIKVSLEDFRGEQKRLRDLLRVWSLLRDGDPEEAQAAAKEAGVEFAGHPHFALSVHLSNRLVGLSNLSLISTRDRLEPVLYCRDVLTGLYALLFQAVVAGSPWAVCLNCENFFLVGRENKKFCRERCQQAYKQQRYRNAEKQKSKKRKRNKR